GVEAVRPVERDPGDAVTLRVEERLEVGVHGARLPTLLCGDTGVDRVEDVLVQDAAHVGGIPAGRLPFAIRREELLAHLPRLVYAQRVADHAQHLTRRRLRLVGGEPRHRRRRVPGVHAVELRVLLGVLDRDVLAGLTDHPGEAAGADAVGPHAVSRELEAGDDRHRGDACLRCAVVRLARLALEPGARNRVDDRRPWPAAFPGLRP